MNSLLGGATAIGLIAIESTIYITRTPSSLSFAIDPSSTTSHCWSLLNPFPIDSTNLYYGE
ncbi:MAG: hypothetical protein HC796_05750 [Synechococcaceae cyanobacterium RL_1_2]|nr:hypothetical protein [Synechococcaceae cyanobacterium RL_1_2]